MLLPVAQVPEPSIRARLEAYEHRERSDAAELSAIARSVIEQARRSTKFPVWSEACASPLVADSADCGPRLWKVVRDPKQPVTMRAEAAAALTERRDPDAVAALAEILNPLDAARLAPLVPIIGLLPTARAVPLLTRLSESSQSAHQQAACRALGTFDVPESRAALAKVVGAH